MTGALSTLLEGSLDYAGLFPPAALDMREATEHYARHLTEDRIGMLGAFVCPAIRLETMAVEVRDAAWTLSVLATGAETTADVLDSLDQDFSGIEALPRGFEATALEIRVPPALDPGGLRPFVEAVEANVGKRDRAPRRVFYELGWNARWPEALGVLAEKRQDVARGAKIRTGGLEASAFPSPEQVASFLIAARDAGVPWKATAGLHHPVRRFQNEVGTKMHGFLNVFGAASLAVAGRDEATLVRMLSEEDPEQFRFTDDALTWRDHRIEQALIAKARSEFGLSFGSCSYLEPIDDLRALGLL